MNKVCLCAVLIILLSSFKGIQQEDLKEKTFRNYDVIVDTDLGGDPDDIQSLFRLLHYSDILNIRGIISTPCTYLEGHPWDTIPQDKLIREWIQRADLDYLRQLGYKSLMTEASVLETVKRGSQTPGMPSEDRKSEGADHLAAIAAEYSPENPLWVLVWGSMTTVAQTLNDYPEIAPNIRIYSIASSNTEHDSLSRNFVFRFMEEKYPSLWWIENGRLPKWKYETMRGVYQGGDQSGEWNMQAFIPKNIKGHGSTHNGLFREKCGDVFPVANSPKNSLKEGDTPSILYLLSPAIASIGNVDDPTSESWGGRFRKLDAEKYSNYYTDLDLSSEECQETINKWRIQFLSHWKRRWDRYDEGLIKSRSLPIAQNIHLYDEKADTIPAYKLFQLPDSIPSKPVFIAYFPQTAEKLIIDIEKKLHTVKVSPARLNTPFKIKNNRLSFKLQPKQKYAVKLNSDQQIYLFPEANLEQAEKTIPIDMAYYNVIDYGILANSPEIQTAKIQKVIDSLSITNKGVLYFPEGIYNTGTLFMRSGIFIYLSTGAVISGSMNTDDYPVEKMKNEPGWPKGVNPDTNGSLIYFKDVKESGILGNGLLISHGAKFRRDNLPNYRWLNMLRMINASDLLFKDISLIDAIAWNTHIIRSDNVIFEDVKIINEIPPIGWNPASPDGFWNNTDGINPDASRYVYIKNCFAYTGDDCITLKITNTKAGKQENTSNIYVTNSMFMSSTGALKVGTETLGDYVQNVYFENVDILEMKTGYPLKITPRDRSTVRNIYFDNIYLEQSIGYFLEARIMESRNLTQDYHPTINGVFLNNIHLTHDSVYALIKGLDQDNMVKNVTLNNSYVKGKLLTGSKKEKLLQKNKFTE